MQVATSAAAGTGIVRTDCHTTLRGRQACEGCVLVRSEMSAGVLLLDIPVARPQDQVFGPEYSLNHVEDYWMPHKAAYKRKK